MQYHVRFFEDSPGILSSKKPVTFWRSEETSHEISHHPFITIPAERRWLVIIDGSCAAGAAAVADTYIVTSTSCTGPGSIVEAIALANANPGEDTIDLVPGLQIDARTCPPISNDSLENYFIVAVTDSLIIEGNGGALTGNMPGLTEAASKLLHFVLLNQPGVFITGTTPGFLRIGETFQDNPGCRLPSKICGWSNLTRLQRFIHKRRWSWKMSIGKTSWPRQCNHTRHLCICKTHPSPCGGQRLRITSASIKVTFGSDSVFGAIDGGGGWAGDGIIEDSQFLSIDAGYPQNTIYWMAARVQRSISSRPYLAGPAGRIVPILAG